MYKTTILPNGLKVVTVHMPGMQSLSLGIWVKTGGRYETKELAGISHFLEHLLFEDTQKRTSRQIKQAVEGVGGSLNGFTGEEMTCYLVKILSKHLDLSFDVLSDMVLNSSLTLAAIEKERSVITEEINMYKDLPGHFVADLLNELMWEGHPLGLFLTGTVETVKGITRENIVDYKTKFYVPNNMVVVLAGPFDDEQVISSCNKYFKKIKTAPDVSFEKVKSVKKGPRCNLSHKKTEQTHIAMGLHAVSASSPDRFAMSLLHIILGANMSSRLFQEIRETRGLAYEISSGVKKYKDTGAFVVSAGIKNTKFKEALKVILQELKKVKDYPVTEDELKRAKEFYTGQMLMALEDTMDHMLWAGEQFVLLDKILPAKDILKQINMLTADDIMNAAKKYFNSGRLNLAVIGPVKNENKNEIEKIMETL